MENAVLSRPVWQTDDLDEEWIGDEEVEDEAPDMSMGTRSISLTAPLSCLVQVTSPIAESPTGSEAGGTFLIRQDVAPVPLLPQTPGRNIHKGIKDFFSPLPLERMFEPPSPPDVKPATLPAQLTAAPSIPSRLSQTYLPEEDGRTDEDVKHGDDDLRSSDVACAVTSSHANTHKSALECQFTFTIPRQTPNRAFPQAESTPGPAYSLTHPPLTDPRLRLFQLQYDTFTRDHLSAIVDSIAVNTPSGGSGEANGTLSSFGGHGLSRVSEATASDHSHLRSVKRVKLSPRSDYYGEGDGAGAIISRPRTTRKDYIGESRSLMQQIKQARDFSTISTVSSSRSPPADVQDNEKASNSCWSSMVHGRSDPVAEPAIIPQITVSPSPEPTTVPSPPQRRISPSYPSSTIRTGPNEALNRFVSSSTTSGTTITASSAPSFVKHAGPVQMTRIAPSDVPALPDRVGKMVYDRSSMKWVKVAGREISQEVEDDRRDQTMGTDSNGESDDPFRDIESLREDDSGGSPRAHPDPLALEDDGESHEDLEERVEADEEEAELMSFSFDGPSIAEIHPADISEQKDDSGEQTTDSDSDQDERIVADPAGGQNPGEPLDSEDEVIDETQPPLCAGPSIPLHSTLLPVASIPALAQRLTSVAMTPVPPRSALKSTSATPVSALKNTTKFRTPTQWLGHRRSVSFSDGKRDGPIRGLNRREGIDVSDQASLSDSPDYQGSSFVPSVRSKRIAEMMQNLQHQDTEDESSPTKSTGSGRPCTEGMQPLDIKRRCSQDLPDDKGQNSRRIFSRSYKSNANRVDSKGDATFLTEWSFGLARDRLVQVITDIHPFEPYWETLGSIDLSQKTLESVARLKEFLPNLDSLMLNSNQLSWLSGVPTSVRTLSVASNCLSGITSFSHLSNLENLDVSNNDIDSLSQLQCLRHLRELRADGNNIAGLDGLQKLDGLVKLSLQHNQIKEVNFTTCSWSRLEMLNLSHNRLVSVNGLATLSAVVALNLDNNSLGELEPGGVMARLRILRVSANRLQRLNAATYPNLRTLYADNNSLGGLVKGERLAKLENLSLRNQSCRDFHLSSRCIRDVKRLYLSGNKLGGDFIEEPFYNLVYLEVAACRLTTLPREFGRLLPNLRILNLNYNFLEDALALEGLTRLTKLTIIGSRLKGTKGLIRILQRMPDVEMLDFRMNPCTLGWYLPLLVKDIPGALQPSEDGGRRGSWQDMDGKFRRDLPDEAYVGRLAYRGLVMRACPRIQMLDGVEVSEKERTKANHLLQGMIGKRSGKTANIKGKTKLSSAS